jgi:hypothetical protein
MTEEQAADGHGKPSKTGELPIVDNKTLIGCGREGVATGFRSTQEHKYGERNGTGK